MLGLLEVAAKFCTVLGTTLMVISALVSPMVGLARADDYCSAQCSDSCSDPNSQDCLNCMQDCQQATCAGNGCNTVTNINLGPDCYYNTIAQRCSQNGEFIPSLKIYLPNPLCRNPKTKGCDQCVCTQFLDDSGNKVCNCRQPAAP